MEAQSIICDDLRSMMSTHVKAFDTLQQTVNVMTATHHAAVTEPDIIVSSTKRDMTGASRKRTVTGNGVSSRTPHDLSLCDAPACVDKKVSVLDEEQEQGNQCDKATTKPSSVTELPSQESAIDDDDRGSDGNTTTYAEAVNQWMTVHKKANTVPTVHAERLCCHQKCKERCD